MAGITDSIENIDKMIKSIITGTILFSIAILSTVLFMWVNDRKKEIGILLSMCISKFRIGLQFTMEILIIATLSIGLSFFTGKVIAQNIGNKIVEAAGESAQSNIRKGFSSQLGADIESASYIKTIKNIKVKIRKQDLTFVSLGTLFIVSVSQCVKCFV